MDEEKAQKALLQEDERRRKAASERKQGSFFGLGSSARMHQPHEHV